MKLDLKVNLSEHRLFIMGCAMISIIMFHQRWFHGCFFDFFLAYGHLGVDLFLLISGYGISYSLSQNNISHYFKNRVIRMGPTCLFFGLLNSAFLLYFGTFSSSIRVMLWRPFALDYWFIQAIAVYYLLAPLLMWIGKQVPLTFVFYFVVLLSMTHLKPWMLYEYHPMDWAWGRFPAFLAGMCWYQHRISSINVSWTIIGIIALTLIFVFNGSIYYWFILSMPLVVYVLGIFENWIKGTKIVPIIHFFGRYSLEIFLGHVIIYSVLSHFPIKESGWCFFWELLIALPLAFVVNRLGQSVMKRLFPN